LKASPLTIDYLLVLIQDPRLWRLAIETLSPIPLWALLFIFPHFMRDKPRRTKKCFLIGFGLIVATYPVALTTCYFIENTCPVTGSVANFLIMTGTLCLGWALSAAVTNPLNRWFAQRHAAKLAKRST